MALHTALRLWPQCRNGVLCIIACQPIQARVLMHASTLVEMEIVRYRAKLCHTVLNYATLCYIYSNSNIWPYFGMVRHSVAHYRTVWHNTEYPMPVPRHEKGTMIYKGRYTRIT